jgi:hypothetical protein
MNKWISTKFDIGLYKQELYFGTSNKENNLHQAKIELLDVLRNDSSLKELVCVNLKIKLSLS